MLDNFRLPTLTSFKVALGSAAAVGTVLGSVGALSPMEVPKVVLYGAATIAALAGLILDAKSRGFYSKD